ncbi:MAG: inositol monophosphatase [Bacteroidales bacterium]|nr:inositol monophosphatase [Bacteroidales bacterium]
MSENLNEILSKSIDIVKSTGIFIKNEQKKLKFENIETKNIHDFVTYVDKTAEKQLVEQFKQILPEAGFIAEEKTETRIGAVYNWIIDPLDGTTNYIHGLLPVAISVALQKNNETVLGIVYEIGLVECFYAIKGGGAFLNGSKISVSENDKVEKSLIATGFPYYDYKRLPQFMSTLQFFMKNSHGLRRLGSAATDMAYVACGRFEAFYEYSLSPWDVAAGAIIVEEAGGKVCDFDGRNNYLFGREIIATNANIFEEFLHNVKNIMQEK